MFRYQVVLTLRMHRRENILCNTEPVFVDLIRSPRIDFQPGGPVRQPYLSYRIARLHRLAESTFTNKDSVHAPKKWGDVYFAGGGYLRFCMFLTMYGLYCIFVFSCLKYANRYSAFYQQIRKFENICLIHFFVLERD